MLGESEETRQVCQKLKKAPTRAAGQSCNDKEEDRDKRLRKVVKGFHPRNHLEKCVGIKRLVSAADKGKGIRIRFSKTKPKLPSFYNAKLVIDKKHVGRAVVDSEDETSSSLFKSSGGHFPNINLLKGESSRINNKVGLAMEGPLEDMSDGPRKHSLKNGSNPLVSQDQFLGKELVGLTTISNPVVMDSVGQHELSDREDKRREDSSEGNDFCVENSQVQSEEAEVRKEIADASLSGSFVNETPSVQEREAVREELIQEDEKENDGLPPPIKKGGRGGKKCYSGVKHSMKTRSSRRDEVTSEMVQQIAPPMSTTFKWNFEDEIAKVFEKGRKRTKRGLRPFDV
ncbi:hypothetical protein Q3G72_033438 [Acer saccharum]|nr:hypothetical protein Q3G72_033438 [Acer saccharum]